MARLPRVSALVAVAAAAVSAAIVWPVMGLASSGHVASTLASVTFTDSSGDSGDGPDVTTVQVADDSSGTITFVATIGNRPSLNDTDAVQAFFDTDKNSGTGNGGFDYEVAWIQGHQLLMHWDGSQFAEISAKSFSASYKDGQARFSIGKDGFGGSVTFNLIVTTTGDTGDSTADRAPNSAVWAYPSGGSTSPPPSPPPPPGSPPTGQTLIGTSFTVAKPHSGRPFTVAMVVRVKQTGIAVKTAVSCSAKLGTKTIRVFKKGSVLSGRASCTWHLPKNTKGQKLKGSITSTYQGAKVKKSFSKTVLP